MAGTCLLIFAGVIGFLVFYTPARIFIRFDLPQNFPTRLLSTYYRLAPSIDFLYSAALVSLQFARSLLYITRFLL